MVAQMLNPYTDWDVKKNLIAKGERAKKGKRERRVK
jgi:hypothetical protein